MTWCPWCQDDPKDGRENRICAMHLERLLQEQEKLPVNDPVVKSQSGITCTCCGFVNPSRGRRPFKKVDV